MHLDVVISCNTTEENGILSKSKKNKKGFYVKDNTVREFKTSTVLGLQALHIKQPWISSQLHETTIWIFKKIKHYLSIKQIVIIPSQDCARMRHCSKEFIKTLFPSGGTKQNSQLSSSTQKARSFLKFHIIIFRITEWFSLEWSFSSTFCSKHD